MSTASWAYFFTAPDEDSLLRELESAEGAHDYYEITGVVPVSGKSPFKMSPGWSLARLETTEPRVFSGLPPALRGTVRHLNYTGTELRSELQKKSAAAYPAGPATLAVLIPIQKSEAWWSMPQDERQKHFEKNPAVRNHAAIGLDYADRIYRRLYHSRYLEGPALGYDFVTYFEFDEPAKPLFLALLAELRNPETHPEWSFVDFELEIWMRKTKRLPV